MDSKPEFDSLTVWAERNIAHNAALRARCSGGVCVMSDLGDNTLQVPCEEFSGAKLRSYVLGYISCCLSSARLFAEVLAIHYDPLSLTLRAAILRQPGSDYCEVRRCIVTPDLFRFSVKKIDSDILEAGVRAFFAEICARFVAKRVGSDHLDVLISRRVRKCGHPCGLATAPSGIPGLDTTTVPALWTRCVGTVKATKSLLAGGLLRMVAGFDDYMHGDPEPEIEEVPKGYVMGRSIPMTAIRNKGKEKVINSSSETEESDGFDGEKEQDHFVHQPAGEVIKSDNMYWVFDEEHFNIGGRAPMTHEEFLATYFGPSAGKVRGSPYSF